MANLKPAARKLKQAGRYGDTQLVHMSMDEYMALQAMGKLTKNPDTGLPEAFNLGNILDPGGFIRDYGPDILNPLGAFPEHTLFGQLGQIGADIPGSPGSLGAAIDRGEWSNPFSEGQNSFDIFAGGSASSEDPTMRKIGRTVGSIFAGYGAGAALGGAGGAGGAGAGAGTGESVSGFYGAGAGEIGSVGGAMMPAAQAELGAANAISGEVTAGSGMGNAVTAGAAGTSGAADFGPSLFDSTGSSMQGSQGGEAGPGGPGGATFGAEPVSLFSRIINSAFGTPGAAFKTGSNIVGIGSEIYNLIQQRKMQKMAKQAFASTQQLQANPGMITSLPGYQFGLDEGRRAIERRGAASGSGGNEAIALARYTPEYAQQFYDREFARRANLDQAQAQLNLGANTAASKGNAQSIGNIGFALARIFAG